MKLLVITTGRDGGYALFDDKKLEAYGPSSIMRDYDSFSEIVLNEWKPYRVELVSKLKPGEDEFSLEEAYWIKLVRSVNKFNIGPNKSETYVSNHYGFKLGDSKQMRSIARKLPCCRMKTIQHAPLDGQVMAILAGWMEVGYEKLS